MSNYIYKKVLDPDGVIRRLRLKDSKYRPDPDVDVARVVKIRDTEDAFQKIREFLSDSKVATYDPTSVVLFSMQPEVFLMSGNDEEGGFLLLARWEYDGDRLKDGYYRELSDPVNRPALTPEQEEGRLALALGLGLIPKAE